MRCIFGLFALVYLLLHFFVCLYTLVAYLACILVQLWIRFVHFWPQEERVNFTFDPDYCVSLSFPPAGHVGPMRVLLAAGARLSEWAGGNSKLFL